MYTLYAYVCVCVHVCVYVYISTVHTDVFGIKTDHFEFLSVFKYWKVGNHHFGEKLLLIKEREDIYSPKVVPRRKK